MGVKLYTGLDIGSHAVKVAAFALSRHSSFQLSRGGGGLELAHLGMAELNPPGMDPGTGEPDDQLVIDAIHRAVADSGIKKVGKCVIGVSGQSVTVRFIQMPRMTERELRDAVNVQAEQLLPFDRASVVMDSQILESAQAAEEEMMKVLLVAVRRDEVQRRVDLVARAGYPVAAVDVDAFSALACFLTEDETSNENLALVNIGSKVTSINIVRNGASHFHRDFSIGGSHLTKAIEDRFGVGFALAEALKTQHGILSEAEAAELGEEDRNPEVGEAMFPVLQDIAREIRRSFSYYEHQMYDRSVERVILSGGTAMLRGLRLFLSRELETQVDIGDPTARIPVSESLPHDKIANFGPGYTVAIGLAGWK
ncbi:MAG: type IV pilus assembly protein PilM [Candidatus Eisenbacteria bacterium]|jgi:type IV pilus assembly protein PilM|nr:type IV pilus assembly protein PilM [Candidatus Eisenbacteria bacterium]